MSLLNKQVNFLIYFFRQMVKTLKGTLFDMGNYHLYLDVFTTKSTDNAFEIKDITDSSQPW